MPAVHPNVLRRSLAGQAAHQSDDAVLGRRVMRDPRQPPQPGDRIRQVDRPGAPRSGAGPGPAGVPHAGEVDGESLKYPLIPHPLPGL